MNTSFFYFHPDWHIGHRRLWQWLFVDFNRLNFYGERLGFWKRWQKTAEMYLLYMVPGALLLWINSMWLVAALDLPGYWPEYYHPDFLTAWKQQAGEVQPLFVFLIKSTWLKMLVGLLLGLPLVLAVTAFYGLAYGLAAGFTFGLSLGLAFISAFMAANVWSGLLAISIVVASDAGLPQRGLPSFNSSMLNNTAHGFAAACAFALAGAFEHNCPASWIGFLVLALSIWGIYSFSVCCAYYLMCFIRKEELVYGFSGGVAMGLCVGLFTGYMSGRASGFMAGCFMAVIWYLNYFRQPVYLWYLFRDVSRQNLSNNIYLHDAVIWLPLPRLEKKLLNDAVQQPELATELMEYLMRYRPLQHHLARKINFRLKYGWENKREERACSALTTP